MNTTPAVVPHPPAQAIKVFARVCTTTQNRDVDMRDGYAIASEWAHSFDAIETDSQMVMQGLPCAAMGLRCGDMVEITVRRVPAKSEEPQSYVAYLDSKTPPFL